MGNIRPYGRPKGRNHVGIYLFETISEQVFSASADCIENAAVRQTEKNTLSSKRVADQRDDPSTDTLSILQRLIRHHHMVHEPLIATEKRKLLTTC